MNASAKVPVFGNAFAGLTGAWDKIHENVIDELDQQTNELKSWMEKQTVEVKQHMERQTRILQKQILASTAGIMRFIDESTHRTINTMMVFWSSMDKNYQELKATQQVNHWQEKYAECQELWDTINVASKEFNCMIADFET